MAQLNKEKLSRTLISTGNDSFRKEAKKFRDVMQRERTAFTSGNSISGMKAVLLADFEQYALVCDIGAEEMARVMIGLSGLPMEKIRNISARDFGSFENGKQLVDAILEEGSVGIKAREETILRLMERGGETEGKIAAEIFGCQDQFCVWAQDYDQHIEILEFSVNTCITTIEELAKNPNLNAEDLETIGGFWMEALVHAMEIQKIASHTYIATRELGIEIPTYMHGSLENGQLSPIWKQLTPEKYQDPIWRIGFVPPEDIAKELLKMLFPKRWEKLLKDCMEKTVVVKMPKKPVLPAEQISLAKRLVREYPEESFPENYVKELGKACEWNEGTAVSIIELEYYGINREDALFLVQEGLDAEIVGKHTLVASILESEGIAHKQLHYAFKVLNEDMCWDIMEVLHNYFGWMEVMPGKAGEREGQEISAVLALVSKPPSSREGVYPLLKKYEDEIFECLVELESGTNRVEKAFMEYSDYSKRFVKNGASPEEKDGEEDEDVVPAREIERPHQSLELSQETKKYISSKGILVENVKRAIIYGLRLSSRKSAIGGKYFPISAFRKNVRTVLSREGGNPEERVKVIEDFLYKEGVISYYKHGDVVKLNLKDEIGQHNEPSEIGQQILDSVISWKVEFDRKTRGGNGS